MAPEPFEPDHPRYHHAGCCGAHVAVAARCVVIMSLISLAIRMFLLSHPSTGEWAQTVCVSNLESMMFECLCVILLHGAVSKEYGPLVFPYVVSQMLNILHILKMSFVEITAKSLDERVEAFKSGRSDLLFEDTERAFSFDEKIAGIKSRKYDLVDIRNPKKTLLITSIVRFVWIAVIVYFIFIILNYFLFLKRRAEAYQAHATRCSQTISPPSNARQTILDYQLSQAPRFPPETPVVPPYQPMAQDHMFEPPPPYKP